MVVYSHVRELSQHSSCQSPKKRTYYHNSVCPRPYAYVVFTIHPDGTSELWIAWIIAGVRSIAFGSAATTAW